ncbi:MAG: CBS domain-containing protein [Acidimicrobiales bacterium]
MTTAITAIMTSDPSTIEQTEPLSEAYQLLQRAPFHHLVVVDGDDPVGIIATSDILRLVYDIDGTDDRSLRTYIDHQFNIDDAMSVDLRTVNQEATVRDVAALLSDGSFHSVVVLADDGSLAGIVTTTDLARYLADQA